jgi:hypothetical protein
MSEEPSAVEAEREPNFLLARWERPTLSWNRAPAARPAKGRR